jgi:hypothetical protein
MTNTFREIQSKISRSNEENGFHEIGNYPPEFQVDYIAKKLLLAVGEISEAIEELRHGHDPLYRYYREDGKPEGFPSEVADAVIRLIDIADELHLDLEDVITEKLAFNATRGEKHGRKF